MGMPSCFRTLSAQPTYIVDAHFLAEYDEYSIEVVINGTAGYIIPGKYLQLPEDCYPAEHIPADWEVDSVTIYQAEGQEQFYNASTPLGRFMIAMVTNNDALVAEFETQIEQKYGIKQLVI